MEEIDVLKNKIALLSGKVLELTNALGKLKEDSLRTCFDIYAKNNSYDYDKILTSKKFYTTGYFFCIGFCDFDSLLPFINLFGLETVNNYLYSKNVEYQRNLAISTDVEED